MSTHRRAYALVSLILYLILASCTGSPVPESIEDTQLAEPETPEDKPATSEPVATETGILSPTSTSLDETQVSLYGIEFAFDSSLGEIIKVEKLDGSPCDSMNPQPAHIVFSFEFYNVARNFRSPTLSVYSVQEYEQLCPDPDWLIGFFDPLREAITNQSVPPSLSGPEGGRTFEVQRVRSGYFQFQNGAGIQAIVSYGQDLYFIERDNIEYKFEGLTYDGEYYVEIHIPVTAPFLIEMYEPGQPQNEQTIPVPEHDPSDYQQFAQAVEAYNEEARKQLEALEASGFTPDLRELDALVASLRIEPQAWGE
ncbi:MAG: hypothetical protein GTO14_13710 [Anaerolineales bacterium]|nr:hypothetical protein [Anaerolineales bacterium]